MKTQITIRLDEELKRQFEQCAKAEERSLNQWLNLQLVNLLKDRKAND